MKRVVLLIVLWACPEPAVHGWALSAGEQKIIQVSPPLSVTLLRNEEYFRRLVAEIREAKKEIDVAVFLFRPGTRRSRVEVLLDELRKAVTRGVSVRVILERSRDPGDSVTSDNREAALRLKEGGVEVSFDSLRRRSHVKVVVIDSRLTFIGSHNFTEAALKFNNELSVLVESPECAGMAKKYISGLRRGE